MDTTNSLLNIQQKLKAPKGQVNRFGGYTYRSCEDILTAVKPILAEEGCVLTIEDNIVQLGDRYYVKATAAIAKEGSVIAFTTAFAREAEQKKGMDEAQITGSASSYARKYALNGLFAIDDTKDPDATNDHGMAPSKVPSKAPSKAPAQGGKAAPAQQSRSQSQPKAVRDLF